MSAHTPGPWWFNDGEGKYFPHVVLGGDDPHAYEYVTINTCAGRNGGEMAECVANARLISAAPDLLAALEAVLFSTTPAGHPKPEAIERASAAIAKARGGK